MGKSSVAYSTSRQIIVFCKSFHFTSTLFPLRLSNHIIISCHFAIISYGSSGILFILYFLEELYFKPIYFIWNNGIRLYNRIADYHMYVLTLHLVISSRVAELSLDLGHLSSLLIVA